MSDATNHDLTAEIAAATEALEVASLYLQKMLAAQAATEAAAQAATEAAAQAATEAATKAATTANSAVARETLTATEADEMYHRATLAVLASVRAEVNAKAATEHAKQNKKIAAATLDKVCTVAAYRAIDELVKLQKAVARWRWGFTALSADDIIASIAALGKARAEAIEAVARVAAVDGRDNEAIFTSCKQQLREFEGKHRLVFPPTLTSSQLKELWEIAEELGLLYEIIGSKLCYLVVYDNDVDSD